MLNESKIKDWLNGEIESCEIVNNESDQSIKWFCTRLLKRIDAGVFKDDIPQQEIYVVQGHSGVLFTVTHDCKEAFNYAEQTPNGCEVGTWKNGKIMFVETVEGVKHE